MSVEKCIDLCAGYKYAGVQDGTECYCGDNPPPSKITWKDECNKQCPGNNSQKCGAGWRMNIHKTGNLFER